MKLVSFILAMTSLQLHPHNSFANSEQFIDQPLASYLHLLLYFQVQELLNNKEHLLTINDRTVFGETALYFASYIGSIP